MARIPQEIINRINDTADIVEIVSKYVDLKQRGRNFFGLCPFHNEKTPSFSVAPDKGIYHCIGCGNGGNAVNFIMEYEKISFVDAIQQIGGQLGIEVEFSGNNESKEFFHQLYDLHEYAAQLYQKNLFSDKGENAKKYQIGVVLKSFNKKHVSESIQDIDNLLEKDKIQIRQQCRLIGLAYRGQSNIDKILNNIFQHTFFS